MNEPRDILRFPQWPRRPVMGRAVHWLTLLSFTAGTIGVPLEPAALWGVTSSPACAKRPGEACKCSSVSRTLGKCCCTRNAAKSAVTAESASERRPEAQCGIVCSSRKNEANRTPSRSCCANKLAAKLDQAQTITEQPPRTLSIEACGCGSPTSSAAILLCGDPRVLPDDAALTVAVPTLSHATAADQLPRGQRPRPAVPPPKTLPA
ncbi:MAG TPA: hypothetical protein VM165_14550 [Planctomycetaceae bacterium]|nr:hypothetical protein [Planctomycetaceae bacterium]